MKENNSTNQASIVKDYILTALILLSKEKTIYSINVSELCARAGVSRMSFYRHYTSIDDIISKQLDSLFSDYLKLEERLKGQLLTPSKKDYIIHYFDYLYEHRAFIDMLIAYGIDTIFLSKQTEYLKKLYNNSKEFYTKVAFAGAIYNLFRLWSLSNYTIDKNELISYGIEL